MGGDPPIVIDTGGSVRIDFPPSIFKPDTGNGKFKNADKEIKRVEVTVGGKSVYDQNGLAGQDVVVKVHYGNP
jgi:hypothetical protein